MSRAATRSDTSARPAGAGANRVVLLGPQAQAPTLAGVVEELGLDGPIATVTAGWQEWEQDDGAMRGGVGVATWPLSLYERGERVWEADPELRAAHHEAQKELRLLQRLYRRQLGHAADAWMELLDTAAPGRVVDSMRDGAVHAIQALDEAHLERLKATRLDYETRLKPAERPAVVREREEIVSILEGCDGIVLEGGHVAVLLNRLRLFGVDEELTRRPVIACSGGAMALCDRVMLYHDSPAVGRGHAEVGLPGLGLVPDVVVLPEAAKRLHLDDPGRMLRFAVRVAPRRCLTLDPGERVDWDGSTLTAPSSRVVARDGTLQALEGAA